MEYEDLEVSFEKLYSVWLVIILLRPLNEISSSHYHTTWEVLLRLSSMNFGPPYSHFENFSLSITGGAQSCKRLGLSFSMQSLASLYTRLSRTSIWFSLTLPDPDIMQFPLSLVTAAAVMEGILSALVREYQNQAPWHEAFRHRRLSRKKSVQECDSESDYELRTKSGFSSFSSSMSSQSPFPLKTSSGYDTFALRKAHEHIRRARMESKGVLLDIQAALGIADVRFYFYLQNRILTLLI